MKIKTTRRWWSIAILVLVSLLVLGYNSASLSLDACDAAMNGWLPKGAPAGAQQSKLRAEHAALFVPFVNKAVFSKTYQLDPYTYQFEQGTRYHFALYGHVIPLWTSISRKGTMDIEGP